MHSKPSWQQSAVTLFSAAAARLTEDARQLGEAVGWSKTLHTEVWRRHAEWLAPSRSSAPAED